MKQNFFRSLAFLMVLATLCCAFFSGCSDIQTAAAVTYKDSEISRALFLYLCSVEKTNYLYEAYGVTPDQISSSQLQDNEAIWTAKDSTGLSAADSLKATVLQKIQITLYMQQYAMDQGYKLNSDQKQQVQDQFNKNIRSFGSKADFNRQMKQYGVDYDQLLEYNYVQSLAYQGSELLFGENGTMKVSEESARKYFEKNFITVQSIFINTKNKTYPNGKVVLLPAEEKEEKLQLVNDILSKLEAGEDFATLCAAHSDEGTDDTDAKGYTFEKGGFVNSVAEEKAFAMASGETLRVDVDGGVYILRRADLNEEYFAQKKDTITENIRSAKEFSLVSEVFNQFKLDEKFMNEIEIATLPHMV